MMQPGSSTGLKNNLYHTNHVDDYTTTNVTYIGCEDKDGQWLIKKVDDTGNYPIITYATIVNNPTITTYANAFANRVTLTYGIYSSAVN